MTAEKCDQFALETAQIIAIARSEFTKRLERHQAQVPTDQQGQLKAFIALTKPVHTNLSFNEFDPRSAQRYKDALPAKYRGIITQLEQQAILPLQKRAKTLFLERLQQYNSKELATLDDREAMLQQLTAPLELGEAPATVTVTSEEYCTPANAFVFQGCLPSAYLEALATLNHQVAHYKAELAKKAVEPFKARFNQYPINADSSIESRKEALNALDQPIKIEGRDITFVECCAAAPEMETLIKIEYPQRVKELKKEVFKFEQCINTQKSTVNALLTELSTKVSGIKEPDLKKYGEALCHALTIVFDEYFTYRTANAQKEFISDCTTLIKNAKPVFEQSLNWGAYLANLLRRIANAVLGCVSNTPTFFPLTKTEPTEIMEKMEAEVSAPNPYL